MMELKMENLELFKNIVKEQVKNFKRIKKIIFQKRVFLVLKRKFYQENIKIKKKIVRKMKMKMKKPNERQT